MSRTHLSLLSIFFILTPPTPESGSLDMIRRLCPICISLFTFLLAAENLADPVAHAQPNARPEFEIANFSDETLKIDLPAVVEDFDLGGDGRYIAMFFKSENKVGIFDVNELKITSTVPVPSDTSRIAAGLSKLLVYSNSGIIVRWDLATGKKELARPLDIGGPINHLLFGSGSEGPAVLTAQAGSHQSASFMLNLETLKAEPMVIDDTNTANARRVFGRESSARISANGAVIGVWKSRTSPSGIQTYVKCGKMWKPFYLHASGGALLPSADGRVLNSNSGRYTSKAVPLTSKGGRDAISAVPAVHGPFFMSVNPRSVDVMIPNQLPIESTPGAERVPLGRKIGSFPLEGVSLGMQDRDAVSRFTLEKRLYLIPEAKLALQIAPDKTAILASKIDLQQALNQSDFDYLFITSRPPRQVDAGERFRYEIQAICNSEEVGYSLDAGPTGMEVDNAGLVTWQPDTKSPAVNRVIVSAGNPTGTRDYQTFELKVNGGATSQQIVTRMNEKMPTSDDITITPSELDHIKRSIPLPGTIDNVVAAGGGRFLLCHLKNLETIAVVDVCKAKTTAFLSGVEPETLIVGGAENVLLYSPGKDTLARYKLGTFELEATVPSPFAAPIRSAAMGAGSKGPVIVHSGSNLHFFDPRTLSPITYQWKKPGTSMTLNSQLGHITASTNGRQFCIDRIGVVEFHNNVTDIKAGSGWGGPLCPSGDGMTFFQRGKLHDASFRLLNPPGASNVTHVPATTGNYYLGITSGYVRSANLNILGESRPLANVSNVMRTPNGSPLKYVALHRRVFFVPDANVVAIWPDASNRIDLMKLNIDETLEASGGDYLFVTSQAPSQAERGKRYTYPVKVKSKRGSVNFNLDDGPTGMSVSSDGVFAWDVPKDANQASHKVIVSVDDSSGQSVFHTFIISLPEMERERQLAEETQRDRERQNKEHARFQVDAERMKAAREQAAARESMRREADARKRADDAEVVARFLQQHIPPKPRLWTDNTGRFKIQGVFAGMPNKQTVTIKTMSGETKSLPLIRLSAEDRYEAIKQDLITQAATKNKNRKTESPFEDIND